jgi:hypothetical protein
MKRKNFLSLTIMAVAMILTIGLTSCTPKEPCEKNHTGTVTIKNELGLTATVKIESENGTTPSQKITDGSTGTFNNVGAGDITILETDAQTTGWDSFEGANCVECETTDWRLYWNGRKGEPLFGKGEPLYKKGALIK